MVETPCEVSVIFQAMQRGLMVNIRDAMLGVSLTI
jgi:hypothetical protein